MIQAKLIKPLKRGQSDFFSWNLYRWLKKDPEATTIWQGTWNSINGIHSGGKALYIGYSRDHDWIHARLLRNLCSHGESLESYAYGLAHDTPNWVDITDRFWKEYLEKGVCAIHGDYSHKWLIDDDLRICEYCGKAEKRSVELIENEVWAGV